MRVDEALRSGGLKALVGDHLAIRPTAQLVVDILQAAVRHERRHGAGRGPRVHRNP